MASVLNFPSRFFAERPEERAYVSPSAEEAAMTRPRHGLRVVPAAGFGEPRRESGLDFSKVIGLVMAQIDGEITQQTGRERVGRLFPGPGTAA